MLDLETLRAQFEQEQLANANAFSLPDDVKMQAQKPVIEESDIPDEEPAQPDQQPTDLATLRKQFEAQYQKPANNKGIAGNQRKQAVYSIVQEKAHKYGLDPDYMMAFINAESGYDPNIKGSSGEVGLMQLMPGTAKEMGVQDRFDPEQNIEGGFKYFRQQLDRFGGDVTAATAAYNAGPGVVQKYGGVPPYPVTQKYVKYIRDSYAKNKGTYQEPQQPQEISLKPADNLEALREEWEISQGLREKREEPGMIGSLIRGGVAGFPGAVDTLLNAAGALGLDTDEYIDKLEKWTKENKRTAPPKEGFNRDLYDAAESVSRSIVSRVPGMAVGAAAGGPVGAAVGAVASGGALYGLAEYNGFLRDVKKYAKQAGADPEEAVAAARDKAILSGIAEWGFETVGDLAIGKVLGVFGKGATSSIREGLKTSWKKAATNYLKKSGKISGTEMVTEFPTGYAQTELRQEAGIPTEQTPMEAGMQSAKIAALSGPLFGLVPGAGGQAGKRVGQGKDEEIVDLTDEQPEFEMRDPKDAYAPYSPEMAQQMKEGARPLGLPEPERGFTSTDPEDVYAPYSPEMADDINRRNRGLPEAQGFELGDTDQPDQRMNLQQAEFERRKQTRQLIALRDSYAKQLGQLPEGRAKERLGAEVERLNGLIQESGYDEQELAQQAQPEAPAGWRGPVIPGQQIQQDVVPEQQEEQKRPQLFHSEEEAQKFIDDNGMSGTHKPNMFMPGMYIVRPFKKITSKTPQANTPVQAQTEQATNTLEALPDSALIAMAEYGGDGSMPLNRFTPEEQEILKKANAVIELQSEPDPETGETKPYLAANGELLWQERERRRNAQRSQRQQPIQPQQQAIEEYDNLPRPEGRPSRGPSLDTLTRQPLPEPEQPVAQADFKTYQQQILKAQDQESISSLLQQAEQDPGIMPPEKRVLNFYAKVRAKELQSGKLTRQPLPQEMQQETPQGIQSSIGLPSFEEKPSYRNRVTRDINNWLDQNIEGTQEDYNGGLYAEYDGKSVYMLKDGRELIVRSEDAPERFKQWIEEVPAGKATPHKEYTGRIVGGASGFGPGRGAFRAQPDAEQPVQEVPQEVVAPEVPQQVKPEIPAQQQPQEKPENIFKTHARRIAQAQNEQEATQAYLEAEQAPLSPRGVKMLRNLWTKRMDAFKQQGATGTPFRGPSLGTLTRQPLPQEMQQETPQAQPAMQEVSQEVVAPEVPQQVQPELPAQQLSDANEDIQLTEDDALRRYVESQPKSTDASWDVATESKYIEGFIKPLLRKLAKNPWLRRNDLEFKRHRGDARNPNNAIQKLIKAGVIEVGWDAEGNSLYALKGTPVTNGVYTESTMPQEQSGIDLTGAEAIESALGQHYEQDVLDSGAYDRIDEIRNNPNDGIDPNSIARLHGMDAPKEIVKRVGSGILKKGGRGLDDVAKSYGFTDGQELYNALISYVPKKQLKQKTGGTNAMPLSERWNQAPSVRYAEVRRELGRLGISQTEKESGRQQAPFQPTEK